LAVKRADDALFGSISAEDRARRTLLYNRLCPDGCADQTDD
jgi:hypothetical protein